MATAPEVARYIVKFFQEAGDPVTNLKLQKLIYYVQGWHLAVLDRPAFNERLEAWIHGPVQPGVYAEFRDNRWNPIVQEVQAPNLAPDLLEIVGEVLEVYGADSAYDLERRTHMEDPWLEARNGISPDQESHAEIRKDWMQTYFKSLANGK